MTVVAAPAPALMNLTPPTVPLVPAAAPADAPPGPASLRALFLAFTGLAMQGFGGVLPVTQRVLVEQRRWLTKEQFVEMLAVSQVLPGPNVVNLALMYGDRVFGARGAFTALAGMLLAPLIVVLALAALYGHFADIPAVAGALRGMGAVAAGLIIATAMKLLGSLRTSPLGRPLALGFATLMFVATGMLRWPLVAVLGGLGAVAIGTAWYCLRPALPAIPPAP